jgi:hypothetical protein
VAHGFQSALSGSRFYQASGFAGGYDWEEGGDPPKWPAEGSKKIFAYLGPRYKDFEKIV